MKIHGPVQYSYDFDGVLGHPIEDDMPAADKAAVAATDIVSRHADGRTLADDKEMLSQSRKIFLSVRESPASAGIACDIPKVLTRRAADESRVTAGRKIRSARHHRQEPWRCRKPDRPHPWQVRSAAAPALVGASRHAPHIRRSASRMTSLALLYRPIRPCPSRSPPAWASAKYAWPELPDGYSADHQTLSNLDQSIDNILIC